LKAKKKSNQKEKAFHISIPHEIDKSAEALVTFLQLHDSTAKVERSCMSPELPLPKRQYRQQHEAAGRSSAPGYGISAFSKSNMNNFGTPAKISSGMLSGS
jgi:hypothetical protein